MVDFKVGIIFDIYYYFEILYGDDDYLRPSRNYTEEAVINLHVTN